MVTRIGWWIGFCLFYLLACAILFFAVMGLIEVVGWFND